MHKVKCFILFLLCSLIVFNTFLYRVDFNTFTGSTTFNYSSKYFSSKNNYNPKASVGVGAISLGGGFGSVLSSSSLKIIGSALSVSAPYIVAVLSVAILAGVVFANKDSIIQYLKRVLDIVPQSAVETDEKGKSHIQKAHAQNIIANIPILVSAPRTIGNIYSGTFKSLKIGLPASVDSYPIALKIVETGPSVVGTNYRISSSNTAWAPAYNGIISSGAVFTNIAFKIVDNVLEITEFYHYHDEPTYSGGYMSTPACPGNTVATVDLSEHSLQDLVLRVYPDRACDANLSIDTVPWEDVPSATRNIPYVPRDISIPDDGYSIPNNIPIDSYIGDTAYDNVNYNINDEPSNDSPASGLFDWLKEILNKILAALSSLSFIEVIKDFCFSIVTTLSNIWDWCGSVAGSFASAVGDVIGSAIEGIKSVCVDIGATLSKIWDWCGSVAGSFAFAIGNIFTGLIEGIKSVCVDIGVTLSKIWEWCGSLASSITSPIINFFTVPSANTFVLSDLQTIFPFCIPFDVIDIIKLFLVDPQPIVFSYDLDYVFGSHKFNFDFSEWHPISTICRTFFSLIFIVSLAFVTKKLIKW